MYIHTQVNIICDTEWHVKMDSLNPRRLDLTGCMKIHCGTKVYVKCHYSLGSSRFFARVTFLKNVAQIEHKIPI